MQVKEGRPQGWRVGKRVARQNSDELGTIVAVDAEKVKVKWDRGRTSYYRPDKPGNVRLVGSEQ
jgi:hypothetical protein